MKTESVSSRHIWLRYLALIAALAALGIFSKPALSQTVSTWSGGAGAWSDCPPGGTALWSTCPDPPNGLGPPNGNFDAVIDGGPVTATSASIVNLTINSGGSLVFPATQPSILDIMGSSILNNGSITLAGTDGLQIDANATVTLSGSGSVTMAGNAFTGANGSTLIVQQTVQGQGTFAQGPNLINQSTISASGGTLALQPVSAVNTGTMQAASGGTLVFRNGTATPYNNAGGTIQALNGGIVQLEDGVYTGGILTTSGKGVIQASNGAVLNALTNNGLLEPSGATLEGAIINNGTIQVSSATLYMSGNVTLSGSGTLAMSGSANLSQLDSTDSLTNQALIHGSGTINQLPLTNQGTIAANISGNTLFLSVGAVTNTATLEASSGGMLEIEAPVENVGGTIAALSNSVVILSGISNGSVSGGTLATSGTGSIESQNGTLNGTVNTVTNAGQLTANNYDLSLQGTINNTGAITLSNGSCIVINKPTTLNGSGKVTMASGTCIYGGGIAFTNKSSIQGAGSIGDSNPMPITNNGVITANLSSPLLIVPDTSGFANTGKLIVAAGSTLNISAPFTNLSSTGILTGGSYSVNGTLALPNGIVTNAAAITLTGSAAELLDNVSSTNALTTLALNSSKGVLLLQSGQALTTASKLSSAGKTTVTSGSSLSVNGSYALTGGVTTVDGTLSATKGLTAQKGSLLGQGTLQASVSSDATIIVGDSTTQPGKLTVTGYYTQGTSGALDVAIGGTQAGTQYSQLAVANGTSLNGTLNVALVNGFNPAIGDTFTILTASAITGQFAQVNGLTINSSEHFEIGYSATAITVTVLSGS